MAVKTDYELLLPVPCNNSVYCDDFVISTLSRMWPYSFSTNSSFREVVFAVSLKKPKFYEEKENHKASI